MALTTENLFVRFQHLAVSVAHKFLVCYRVAHVNLSKCVAN